MSAAIRVALAAGALALANPADAQQFGGARAADCAAAVAGDVTDSAVTVVCGMPTEQVVALVQALSATDPAAKYAALAMLRARLPADAAQRLDAIAGFFRILGQNDVPPERLADAFAEIATRHREMLERLAALNPEDPAVAVLVTAAKAEIDAGRYEAADGLLAQAEALDIAALRQAEALAAAARDAADRRRRGAAASRAERAELAGLRLDHLGAAAHWAEAASLLPPVDALGRWTYEMRGAAALRDRGREFGDNAALEVVVTRYRYTIVPLAPRGERPAHWATTQNNLGIALTTIGERENGTARLEEAVAAYRAALEERTRERVPHDWATTQNNLGNALQSLGDRESGTARLEEAVAAYRAALGEWTRERFPLDWALTQNNLGNALQTLAQRENGTARLEEAVAAYRAALELRTRERKPVDWALTQNNLGNALATLGERASGTARLEEAVAAFRAALEELTRERVPLHWAATQNNLGNALTVLGARESGTARLEEAVAACRAALEERMRERVPLDWAMSTGNLGVALMTLAERRRDAAMAAEAEAQIETARDAMREGGHGPAADYYAGRLPEARALRARLSP